MTVSLSKCMCTHFLSVCIFVALLVRDSISSGLYEAVHSQASLLNNQHWFISILFRFSLPWFLKTGSFLLILFLPSVL